METRLIGAGIRTSLGEGLDTHAAALQSADQRLLNLPSPVSFEMADESIQVPYHLAAPLDTKTDLQSRFHSLLEETAADAIEAARLSRAELDRVGVFVGTSSMDIGLIEDQFRKDIEKAPHTPQPNWRCSMESLAPRLRDRFGLGPEGVSVNTACTASANALLYADSAIRQGRIDHALVVGCEIFNATTALGFHSLDLLTSSLMRPFDNRRNGLILGEACSAVILSKSNDVTGMHFMGGATLSDGHSISAANPDGSTIEAVIRKALERANISARDITAIKAHATASLLNDEGEAAGLHRVFDALPPIVALKPYIGHTFGASGLTELLIIKACLDSGFWPSTPGVAANGEGLGIRLAQSPLQIQEGNFLLNQFGFGGNNTSLVVRYDR